MHYVDNCVVLAHTVDKLQALLKCFNVAYKALRLDINIGKSNEKKDTTRVTPIQIQRADIKAVENFQYLGNTITG